MNFFYKVSGKGKLHDEDIDEVKISVCELSKQLPDMSPEQTVCFANTIGRIKIIEKTFKYCKEKILL